MSLFEPEEESGDIAFDEKSKIRLFETQARESRGVRDHLKRFLPVIVVAIIVVGGVIYLMQPGIGDAVAVPTQIKDAVYDYMLTKEKRTATEMTFYKCDGYYWVKILAQPRAYPPSVLDDPVNQYRLEVRSSNGTTADIRTLPSPANASNKPCDTGFIANQN